MKRVVLEHTIGPLAGLRQIVGLLGDTDTPASSVSNVRIGDHVGTATLVHVKPRYVLYQEAPPQEQESTS
jgi:hypothetical protein